MSSVRQGWFLLRSVKDGSVPDLSPWLVDGRLLPAYLPVFCMCVCVQISLCKDTSHIGLDPTLMLLPLDHLCKDPISKMRSHSGILEVRVPTQAFGGDAVEPITRGD